MDAEEEVKPIDPQEPPVKKLRPWAKPKRIRPGEKPRKNLKQSKVSRLPEARRKRLRLARKAYYRTPAGRREKRAKAKRMKLLWQNKPDIMGRRGVPDGMTREQAKAAWAVARESAKETMKKLIENEVIPTATPDDKAAVEALEAALEVLRGPMMQRDKLAAARLILDFTKAKPASKQDITVTSAESWLKQVIEDDKNGGNDRGAIEGPKAI